MTRKVFVIRELGSDHHKPYAVVEHASDHDRHLQVWGWFERESDARALAHSMLFPDYE